MAVAIVRQGERGSWIEMASRIVITRNGRTTVLSGWRAWIAGALAVVLAILALAAVAVLLLGAAISAATLLVVGLPLVVGLAALWSFLRRPPGK